MNKWWVSQNWRNLGKKSKIGEIDVDIAVSIEIKMTGNTASHLL